jgi:mannitol/fructose-specific phosphotransferase system IIA component
MVSKKLKINKQERNETKKLALRKEMIQLVRQKNILSEKIKKLLNRYKQLSTERR